MAARGTDKLRADTIVWNRKTGKVSAHGNVRIANANGDVAYSDDVEVDDSFRDGIVRNLLLVTQSGGRLAAVQGRRTGAVYVLERAAYTPCRVEDDNGCPKEPAWQIKAERVVYNEETQRVSYDGARLELLGLPIVPLPGLRHPNRRSGKQRLAGPRYRL